MSQVTAAVPFCPGLLRNGTFLPLNQLYCLWISGKIHSTRGWLWLYKGNKTKRQNSTSIKYEEPMVIEWSHLVLFSGVWFQPHGRGDEPRSKPE